MRVSLGLGLLAGLGLAAAGRRLAAEAPDSFYSAADNRRSLPDEVPGPTGLELTYHRTEMVVSLHPVDFARARAVLPSASLFPVRLHDGRALLAVSAARYLEGTAPGLDPRDLPYGETMITILVTREPAKPLAPIVRGLVGGPSQPPFGAYLWHMAVTNRAGRDLSRALGYPAFVADFAFKDDLRERRVTVGEGGREIMRLATTARGRVAPDRRPMQVFNTRGDGLFETVCPCSGYAQQHVGRGSGLLELGDHPVADELRALRPSAEAILARSYLNLRIRVPPAKAVGVATYNAGYRGSDRDRGAYTIRYPDGSVIDLHGSVRSPDVALAGA